MRDVRRLFVEELTAMDVKNSDLGFAIGELFVGRFPGDCESVALKKGEAADF